MIDRDLQRRQPAPDSEPQQAADDDNAAGADGKDSAPLAGDGKRPAEKEIGGRGGPDPTRYGDWEKNGRCIDF